MRSEVGLCLLGLICSVFGQFFLVSSQDAEQVVPPVEVQPGVLVFCDDPSVEKAVGAALDTFNEGLTSGYKLALFQVFTAAKSENSVFSVQFTSRRSDCPAGSSKHWSECDYLPTGRQQPILCNATVQLTETETDTKQIDCLLDNYNVPEKAPCLGCPEEIDGNSEDLKVPLSVSISKYNSISDSSHLFTLNSVGYATRQVVAGFRFKVRFDMKKTICAKAEHKDINELCVPDDKNVEFANCNSTVDVAPWRVDEVPQAQIECEQGLLPVVFRRRPPGWSPLRNLLYNQFPTTSPLVVTKAPESSEEETSAATKSTPVVETTSSDRPFHCPSKPWKPFNPAAAASAAPTTASLSPDAVFSDTDMLA